MNSPLPQAQLPDLGSSAPIGELRGRNGIKIGGRIDVPMDAGISAGQEQQLIGVPAQDGPGALIALEAA
jgi:hypothetical protein